LNHVISPRAFISLRQCLIVLLFVWGLSGQSLLAQTVRMTQGLSFGSFVAGNGGTITISPTGARSQTGNVGLITSRGTFSAAQVSISGGLSNAAFSLGFPPDGAASLEFVGASGGRGTSMPLTKFVSSLGSSPRLGPNGTEQLSVGATLTVLPNQPVGDYIATFNITVQFN
jgi:hypothetical protein